MTIQIQAGPHTITAADPLPDDPRQALDHIHIGPRRFRLGPRWPVAPGPARHGGSARSQVAAGSPMH